MFSFACKLRKHFVFDNLTVKIICPLSPYTILSTWKLEFQRKQAVNMEESWREFTKNTPYFFAFHFENFVLCYIFIFPLDLNKPLMSQNLTLLINLLKSDWNTWENIIIVTLDRLRSLFSQNSSDVTKLSQSWFWRLLSSVLKSFWDSNNVQLN